MSQTDRSDKPQLTPLQRRNRRLGLTVAAVFFGMIGAAYASVPLYRAFCDLTGFDGATRRASAAPAKALDKDLTVRFDANVNNIPWDFTTLQTSQEVKIGETKVALFKVTNRADHPVTGRAVFNVVPAQAGPYFQKLSCFCFDDQTIGPGQTVEMPVLYFIDPKYAQDFETRNKKEVTLSYTFFQSADPTAPKSPSDVPHAANTAG